MPGPIAGARPARSNPGERRPSRLVATASANGLNIRPNSWAATPERLCDHSSDCSAVKLQFDAGRGTALRLSQVNLDVGQRDESFFTTYIPSGKN